MKTEDLELQAGLLTMSSGFRACTVILIVALCSLYGFGLAHADLQADYDRAVEDARLAESDEISTDLIAITASEPGLVWEGEPGNSRVLVVSWVGEFNYGKFFEDNEGQEVTLWSTSNLWVTIVPELQDFFQDKDSFPADLEAAKLRIRQLIGLPLETPNNRKPALVEMWVDPGRLFRPSPDPEIIDHEAVLEFSPSSSPFLAFNSSMTIEEYNSDGPNFVGTYEEWFDNLKNSSYNGSDPYPWTRLGYTYDWNTNTSEVGLSEFVVLGNSTVKVESIIRTEDMLDYFTRPDSDGSGSGGCVYNPRAGNDWLYVLLIILLVALGQKYVAFVKHR